MQQSTSSDRRQSILNDLRITPVCLFVSVFVCLCIYLSVCLLACLTACLSVCLQRTSTKTTKNTLIHNGRAYVIDKNKIIYFEGLVTNSVSTTRSLNEEPIKFENIYLRLDNYDFYLKDDYLSAQL